VILLPPPSITNYVVDIYDITNTIQSANVSSVPSYQRWRQIFKTDFNITITPPLQPGQSITFDLTVQNISQIKPYIWSNSVSFNDGDYRMGDADIYGLTVKKNNVTLSPISINPTIPTAPTSANDFQTSATNSVCKDQFDWSNGGNRILSLGASITPQKDYILYQSSTTSTWSVTITNGDIISGTFTTEIFESVFGASNPGWNLWTPPNTYIVNNWRQCETLKNISTISVTNLSSVLPSCTNVQVNYNSNIVNDVFCLRNPFAAGCFQGAP
jgi:hypothetical protein